MKLLNYFLFVITLMVIGHFPVQSANLKLQYSSNLEAGTLGPDDIALFTITSILRPNPNIITEYRDIGVEDGNFIITYLSVIESGEYPEARSEILVGGPGGNFVTIRLTPGPPQGFNYTTIIYIKNESAEDAGRTKTFERDLKREIMD